AGGGARDEARGPLAHRAGRALRAYQRRPRAMQVGAAGRHDAVHRAAGGSAGDCRGAGASRSAGSSGGAASRSAGEGLAAVDRGGARGMIGLILRKELLELRRSPVLLLSMASLPATVVAVPVGLLAWLVHAAPEQALLFAQDVYGLHERDPALGVALILARNWLPMFLVLPIF